MLGLGSTRLAGNAGELSLLRLSSKLAIVLDGRASHVKAADFNSAIEITFDLWFTARLADSQRWTRRMTFTHQHDLEGRKYY